MRGLHPDSFLASHRGEAAALLTALCWSVTPFFFTAASRRVGSFATNLIRLVLACGFLAAAVFVTSAAQPVPWRQAALFAASGFTGLAIGDAALFEAFVLLGPRRTSLLQSTAPVVAAIAAVPLLSEHMSLVGVLGMAMTLGGVAWVVLERVPDDPHGHTARGVLLALVAAAGQGLGLIFAKAGLGKAAPDSLLGLAAAGTAAEEVTPLLGTLLRMVAGCGGMLLYAVLRGRIGETARAMRDGRALSLAALGATFGPFIGVWLSLAAVKFTNVGIAQTIMATSPVVVIAIGRVVHKERASPRVWAGTLLAVMGISVLAFRTEIAEALSR
jgi:drug/metabolite transporter (DMT)-like permease